jgi:hypothetical protein
VKSLTGLFILLHQNNKRSACGKKSAPIARFLHPENVTMEPWAQDKIKSDSFPVAIFIDAIVYERYFIILKP